MNRWYIFESKIIISRVENSFTLIFSNTNFSCFSDWASARTRENCGAAPGENLLCTRIHVRKHEHYTRFYHKGGWGLGESSRGVQKAVNAVCVAYIRRWGEKWWHSVTRKPRRIPYKRCRQGKSRWLAQKFGALIATGFGGGGAPSTPSTLKRIRPKRRRRWRPTGRWGKWGRGYQRREATSSAAFSRFSCQQAGRINVFPRRESVNFIIWSAYPQPPPLDTTLSSSSAPFTTFATRSGSATSTQLVNVSFWLGPL